jgi:hypothetical protein
MYNPGARNVLNFYRNFRESSLITIPNGGLTLYLRAKVILTPTTIKWSPNTSTYCIWGYSFTNCMRSWNITYSKQVITRNKLLLIDRQQGTIDSDPLWAALSLSLKKAAGMDGFQWCVSMCWGTLKGSLPWDCRVIYPRGNMDPFAKLWRTSYFQDREEKNLGWPRQLLFNPIHYIPSKGQADPP